MDVGFIPITKVDVVQREVWGVAAEESPDKTGEIMDYAASKPHFETWSEGIRKASGGKSLGNVRAMHASIAAGKLIHFEARDEERQFYVGAKIVDDQEWQKVLEGVYTGFSVGGKYGRRWHDPEETALMRYEAIPSEISLADNPAMHGATFEVVKADGVTEMRKFVGGALDKVDLEEVVRRVRSAWYQQFGSDDPEDESYHYYILTVLDDAVIVRLDGTLFSYPYQVTDDGITFGEPLEVEERYVPVADSESSSDEAEPEEAASDSEDDEDLARTVLAELQKSMATTLVPVNERLATVEQSLAALGPEFQQGLEEIQEEIQKAYAEQLADLAKRLESLEAQPASEPPVIREVPGSGRGGQQEATISSIEELRRLAALEPDPLRKAEYNRQVLLSEMALGQNH
jgi:hypothetical protein